MSAGYNIERLRAEEDPDTLTLDQWLRVRPGVVDPPAPGTSGGSVAPPEEPPDWHDHAACAGVDPDLFFPSRGASTREAKAVCAGCPVRSDCLEAAMAGGEKFGIWGGMSERERRRLRRERRATA